MTTTLQFARAAAVTTVPGDGIYLTSERGGRTRLHGRGIALLAPLLDGSRTRTALHRELAGGALTAAQLDQVLDALLAAGHVVDADPEVDGRQAGFWELAGLDGDHAVHSARTADLAYLTLGGVDPTDLLTQAAATGRTLHRLADPERIGEHRLTLVLTDDYRRPEVGRLNELALARSATWMLAKPIGSVVWVGPLMVPGTTACAQCLATRLQAKSLTESYLRQRGAVAGSFTPPPADLPVTRALAASLLLLHAERWLSGTTARHHRPDPTGAGAGAGAPTPDPERIGDVWSVDMMTSAVDRHALVRRPQCPACGDPELQARLQRRPVVPVSRPKARTSDGGHRATSPEDFVERFAHFVSPVTGPVNHLVKIPMDLPGIHTYSAGQNFAMPMRTVADLRAGLRSTSCGKGISDIQAKASALGEAIERYSCVFHGDEARQVAALADLDPADVVHPNELHQYSERQFAERDAWNSRPSHFHWVGDALDPTAPVEWTPVWSLTQQRPKLIPTATLFFGYGNTEFPFHAGANSNGCAAGSSLEDAVLQGFFELVERDAVALWWYNRTRHPAIDLASFADPYFEHWQRTYAGLGRRTWVLDITTDLDVPTVVAVSYRPDKPAQDILFALGSHLDVRIAIGRALSEMNQFLPAVLNVETTGRYAFDDPTQIDWWTTARMAEHPYLAPSDAPARVAADYTDASTTDLARDIEVVRERVERAGLEMLVLDHTRPDIGLPVARVIVPGLRHFWPRFAPGRLYDVPVALGLLDHPTAEADLNPVAMFL
ncbi:TOMM precursor leader peptide-binding protein [Nakamurella flavida]|uniref:TOMM leader peptide-binding protein n=1 Tax=Nakamurella flavida TaxID=363630 RepID=A0A939C513_9ACTN|nr:TOMM precursor leader peptide-binding protein [Nakamurella flavida]MBM9476324.1 TOMM precursor leader peptide-binding protein [Nakamurella flavida]MDP9779575.1 ribosomal protein S12 methylthiotransferase accessory factor [Nakamurella flavida]